MPMYVHFIYMFKFGKYVSNHFFFLFWEVVAFCVEYKIFKYLYVLFFLLKAEKVLGINVPLSLYIINRSVTKMKSGNVLFKELRAVNNSMMSEKAIFGESSGG